MHYFNPKWKFKFDKNMSLTYLLKFESESSKKTLIKKVNNLKEYSKSRSTKN
jgi:hypothetical protein